MSQSSMPTRHILAGLGRKQMKAVYHTDIDGTVMAARDEPTSVPSAATMLRDVLDVYAPPP